MRLFAAVLLSLSLLVAGCGGDDEDEPAKEPAQTQTQQQKPPPTATQAEPQPPKASPEDEKAVKETVTRWLLEGDCDVMTDRFLESQLLGLGDTRAERCKLFEKQHQRPQYGEEDIKFSDVRVTGTKASLVVGSENSNVESRYELLKQGGDWKIDAAELQ